MRIFLDINVLVSAFATRGLSADLLQVVLSEHTLILGDAVLAELTRVLRSKFEVPPEVVEETEAFLRRQGEVVSSEVDPDVRIRDEDDVVVVGQALAGKADVLITGDRDLLDVAPDLGFQVLRPREFWELLRSEDWAP